MGGAPGTAGTGEGIHVGLGQTRGSRDKGAGPGSAHPKAASLDRGDCAAADPRSVRRGGPRPGRAVVPALPGAAPGRLELDRELAQPLEVVAAPLLALLESSL